VTSATRPASAGAGRRRAPRLGLTVQYAVPRAGLPAPATLKRWASAALQRDACVTLRFVGAVEGRRLNAAYRGKDYATNVLTFVYDESGRASPIEGDLVLCVPVLRREARKQRKPMRAHCAHLLVHGILHLQGHGHERDADAALMEAREIRTLRELGFPDPYR
jgi:probable rRNA maturation factor